MACGKRMTPTSRFDTGSVKRIRMKLSSSQSFIGRRGTLANNLKRLLQSTTSVRSRKTQAYDEESPHSECENGSCKSPVREIGFPTYMYSKHFGLAELPFSVTPDPRFSYSNSLY